MPRHHPLQLIIPVLILAAQLLAPPAEAKPIPPLQGLEALRRVFSSADDFSARITEEKQLSLLKKKLVMEGRVRFKKPDLFLLELSPPYASRLLLKNDILEQAVEGERPNRIALPPEQGLRRWIDQLARPATAVPEGVEVRADLTGNVYTVTIAPAGSGQVKELTLSFLEDGTLRHLAILERSGDRTTITFKAVKRNVGLSERDFRLQ